MYFIQVNWIANRARIYGIVVRECIEDKIGISSDNVVFKGISDIGGTSCIVRKSPVEI